MYGKAIMKQHKKGVLKTSCAVLAKKRERELTKTEKAKEYSLACAE